MKKAKYQLTELLPDTISYTNTIDEAEKVDAISNVMEVYAENMAICFSQWASKNDWHYLPTANQWRKHVKLGFDYKKGFELFLLYKDENQ